jgi:hypothetical protein
MRGSILVNANNPESHPTLGTSRLAYFEIDFAALLAQHLTGGNQAKSRT